MDIFSTSGDSDFSQDSNHSVLHASGGGSSSDSDSDNNLGLRRSILSRKPPAYLKYYVPDFE